jgi:hypothetical protein
MSLDPNARVTHRRTDSKTDSRETIREQALGAAYVSHDLDVPARYEVHLDGKQERTQAMLVRAVSLSCTSLGITFLSSPWFMWI